MSETYPISQLLIETMSKTYYVPVGGINLVHT